VSLSNVNSEANMSAFLLAWYYFGNQKWDVRVWGLIYWQKQGRDV